MSRARRGPGAVAVAFVLLAPLLLARAASATEQPLWEAGAGASLLVLPHYLGSDQSHTWLLPLPYAIYRGEILRADRDGGRAILFDREQFELNLSVAATAPTRSEDNRAREGMPDLPATFEIGPNFQWHLARGRGWLLDLRIPLRAVFAWDSGLRHAGWSASPHLNVDWDRGGWNLGMRLGPSWGDRRLHALFYEVAPAYATPERPAYDARSGDAGWTWIGAVSRRRGDVWFGAYLRADRLDGAVYVDSPLVRQRNSLAYGLAIAWVFAQSDRRVEVRD
jgi:outer membrane scaffolding protein for murein synthesis (MipA/OmpV family)